MLVLTSDIVLLHVCNPGSCTSACQDARNHDGAGAQLWLHRVCFQERMQIYGQPSCIDFSDEIWATMSAGISGVLQIYGTHVWL